MKKMNKKGFTLAELLIVLAIMAILIAIAIPVFTSQLERARDSVDATTERTAKSLAEAHYMLEHVGGDYNATSILCTFSEDDNGNLEIKHCVPVLTGTPTGGNACTYNADNSKEAVIPQCTCGKYTKELEVTVTSGLVTGGWHGTEGGAGA